MKIPGQLDDGLVGQVIPQSRCQKRPTIYLNVRLLSGELPQFLQTIADIETKPDDPAFTRVTKPEPVGLRSIRHHLAQRLAHAVLAKATRYLA